MNYPEFILDPTSNPPKLFIFIGLLFFILSYIRIKEITLIDEKERVTIRILGTLCFFWGIFFIIYLSYFY
jgi:hypothetical protein